MDYKTSGVDVEAGRDFVNRIRSSVEGTYRPEVVAGLGGFGGLIRLPKGISNPLLVAGTDGVGTKLELAQQYQKHFGVGIDLVAMCVNDVITSGANPLFFLDYIATGSLGPEAMTSVIEGISEACKVCQCALLGGETAEMPGFYSKGQYDLAGFCVAVVEEEDLIDGQKISSDDLVIGISSNGVHSNGFSLVRKVLELAQADENTFFGPNQTPLIEALLKPTALYVPLVQELLNRHCSIHGMAHITGGGLPENLPRCLPKGFNAFVDPKKWEIPLLFRWLQDNGQIPEADLWNTFNLGIGFCLVVAPESSLQVFEICSQHGFSAWPIGHIQQSSSGDAQKIYGLPSD